MASANTSTTAEHLIWKGGTQPMKVGYGKLMMWVFLLSDTFTFSALLVSYGLVRFSFPTFEGLRKNFEFSTTWWPIPERVFEAVPFLHGIEAPLVFVGIMTFILIMSSVTMVLAVEAGHRRDKADVEKYMLWTILGGIAFLSSQAWEWSHFIHGTEEGLTLANGTKIFGANLVQNQYGPPAFADFFFFITGFHGTHVLSGVVLNVLVFYNTANGVYEKRGHYEMIEKVGLYWHFVDLVWVFVFTFFYLV
ncbi:MULTISPECIES: cytochrome c oxidase subunit 3 [Emticicia]|uniref:cytochrome c oxidase subunit 3 n=1 Tax=Emticicia TaxID=312278 RepID=UPI000C75AAE6|nr:MULTISPECIES: cytochrome c oxidase subunit 3 [Emticicia]PLK45812.1 cytochrome oxidase subunit III [Emticicia sp. TH156]UTA67583.1 cytochrome c oxidase subunit 3 [Emticicia sp. 21SJ11W-3]